VLTESVSGMSKSMTTFMEAMAVSEERHNSHKDQMERLEGNQRAQGQDLKEYIANNDNRIVGVEKQILNLEHDTGHNAKKWGNVEKVFLGVITTVGAAIVLAFFVR